MQGFGRGQNTDKQALFGIFPGKDIKVLMSGEIGLRYITYIR